MQKRFGVPSPCDQISKSLDETSVIDFIRLFDELDEAKQKLFDLSREINDHKFCISDEIIERITKARAESDNRGSQIKSAFKKTLIAVRSGEVGQDVLDRLYKNYMDVNSCFSPNEINRIMKSFSDVKDKMDLANHFIRNGVKYIGRGSSLVTEKRNNPNGTIYILFFGSQHIGSKSWGKTEKFFTDLIRSKNSADKSNASEMVTFLAVDLDLCKTIADREEVGDGVRICQYRNGKYMRYNMIPDEQTGNEYRLLWLLIFHFISFIYSPDIDINKELQLKNFV